MKQYISPEEFKLSPKALNKFTKWLIKKGYAKEGNPIIKTGKLTVQSTTYPLILIGIMIKFLSEKDTITIDNNLAEDKLWTVYYGYKVFNEKESGFTKSQRGRKELTSALWDAIKDTLEE